MGHGPPSFLIGIQKRFNTVWDKLPSLHSKNTTLLGYPSVHSFIMKPQRMGEWWPSKCGKEFGRWIVSPYVLYKNELGTSVHLYLNINFCWILIFVEVWIFVEYWIFIKCFIFVEYWIFVECYIFVESWNELLFKKLSLNVTLFSLLNFAIFGLP